MVKNGRHPLCFPEGFLLVPVSRLHVILSPVSSRCLLISGRPPPSVCGREGLLRMNPHCFDHRYPSWETLWLLLVLVIFRLWGFFKA
jgi:hypothetical protein